MFLGNWRNRIWSIYVSARGSISNADTYCIFYLFPNDSLLLLVHRYEIFVFCNHSEILVDNEVLKVACSEEEEWPVVSGVQDTGCAKAQPENLVCLLFPSKLSTQLMFQMGTFLG